MKDILVFEYMIRRNIYEYHCDPWYAPPGDKHYNSAPSKEGQMKYKGWTFVVHHMDGSSGHGGMDEGSPPSVSISRIKKTK